MTPAELRALIAASGLSASRWARDVAGRDPRTVRRWLAGSPIPNAAANWLRRIAVEGRVDGTSIEVQAARRTK